MIYDQIILLKKAWADTNLNLNWAGLSQFSISAHEVPPSPK